jgi:hypothetical protein
VALHEAKRMRRFVAAVVLTMSLMGCASSPGAAAPVPGASGLQPESCIGGLSPATCDSAANVALAAATSSGWTPTAVWIDSGQLCPAQNCLFDPSQNFPYPDPPSGGQWIANAEIAFAGTDQHAGLNIAMVGGAVVPVLIGYRVPLPGWCSGGCPSSVVIDGNYRLELVLSRLSWNVGDPISGTAILSRTDSQPTKVAGAGELIVFAYDEVGGIRHVAPISDQSCVLYPLDPATPQSVALGKSGAVEGNEPDADFLRTFLAGPEIHLPAGTWDISAIASFSETGCTGPNKTMTARVRIQVGE